MSKEPFISPAIEVRQGERLLWLTRMPANVLTSISYAAIRRQSDEAGAIQRGLNPRRIDSIKEFVLGGGDFPNAFVLNWVSSKKPTINSKISFVVEERLAQIIDGQHRVAGIRAAIEEDENFATLQLPVAIYTGLSTRECADIFLSINTEQKPVPRSLVFDLYGVASQDTIDPAAIRARDIAMFLNEDEKSPYQALIKLPGHPTMKGGIALSTAVTAIKPLVEEKSVFEQIDISDLQSQKQIILNLFKALQNIYGEQWWDRDNAFMYAAGFLGAIEFLKLKLITYCSSKNSFKVETIQNALEPLALDLVLQKEVKGKGGSESVREIFARLVSKFEPKSPRNSFEIL